MNKEVFDPKYINLDYIFYQILVFFRAIFGGEGDTRYAFFLWFKNIFSFLAVVFIAIILYCLIRIHEIKQEEAKKRKALLAHPDEPPVPVDTKKYSARWSVVEEHARSDRDTDWRLAILEADAMLEEATFEKGFVGDTLGERLKGVSEQQFPAKQIAWDAHLVRNNIAHQGSTYEITSGEMRKTVDKFKRVLETLDVL